MRQSLLQQHPRSTILESGYVNIYSPITSQERRQLAFTRRYKATHPSWDTTTIRTCALFARALSKFRMRFPKSTGPAVLDAGCGRGSYVIDEFRRDIAWAAGVDVDAAATEGNTSLDETRFASLDRVPYPPASFDIVLCSWVLEHLEHPNAVFREIARVLKPGGAFLFCTPNKHSLLLFLKRLLHTSFADVLNRRLYGRKHDDIFPTRYRANDMGTLCRLLNNAGFSSVDLQQNYDPIYTSFNAMTFAVSNAFEALCARTFPTLSRPHIVGYSERKKDSVK